MPLGSTFAAELAKLILNGQAIANIADNAASDPLINIIVSLHTSDPSAGNQLTDEIAAAGYARVPSSRTAGWNFSGNVANPLAAITFPEIIVGVGTITWIGFGTSASGAGKILISGQLNTPIPIAPGVIPQIKTTSTITFK